MNTKFAAIVAVLATALVFANNAYADSAQDRNMVHALEKKQASESKKMIKVLQDYRQTLKAHDLSNKVMEERVNEKTKATESKIDGIVILLKDGKAPAAPDGVAPTIEIITADKVRVGTPSGTDVARITYRVIAGSSEMQNANVLIDSDGTQTSNTIHGLLAAKSAKHTIFVKAQDPSSVLVKLG